MSYRDYVSPGLDSVDLSSAFPEMLPGERSAITWPYFRKEVGHNWYVDRRSPTVGFVSADEASILYNTAKLAAGRRCLEIGCWKGWSAAHIAKASGSLEVIDPLLDDPEFCADVRASLKRAGVSGQTNLRGGFSPDAVRQLSKQMNAQWAFAFIDGDHEPGGPLRDAKVVAEFAAENAIVLFHDLASPHVAEGLAYFRDAGWQTMVYQTMQIMGVAWRGTMRPVDHIPDPEVDWKLPDHLLAFDVSGAKIGENGRRSRHFDKQLLDANALNEQNHLALMAMQSRILELIERAAFAEAREDHLGSEVQRMSQVLERMYPSLQYVSSEVMRLSSSIEELSSVGKHLSSADERLVAQQLISLSAVADMREQTDYLAQELSRLSIAFAASRPKPKLSTSQIVYLRTRAMLRYPLSSKKQRSYFSRKARKRMRQKVGWPVYGFAPKP